VARAISPAAPALLPALGPSIVPQPEGQPVITKCAGSGYAMVFAGNGPVLALDEALLKQAARVTIRAGESSSADLRATTKPVY
jgi:hypothetical protein